MKVPVFVDLEKMEFQERPKPEIKNDEVLLKVEYCGICGSDVHGYRYGIMIPIGTVMGHEFSGVVAEVGNRVQNVKPGDRVVVKPVAQCGKCYWCQRGQYSLCPEIWGVAPGLTPAHDGALAEYVKIEYPDKMLFKLPENVSFKEAALIEPLATSLHGVRLSRLKPGDRVVVIGAGMIGLGAIQFIKLGGAGKIIALEISSKKSEIAKRLGADVVLNPISEGKDLRGHIFSLTDGIGADLVFDCAGVPFSFQNSINFVKSGGQVMVIGINDKDVPINPFTFVAWEVEMKGALCYCDEFKYVIDFLEQKRINTELLISDIIPLPEIVEKGFKRLLSSQDNIKILVKP